MTVEELRRLPPGTMLSYIYGTGAAEERLQAKVVEHKSGYSGILVYFADKPQQKLRWSTLTNRPVGTKGHLGQVRLER